MSWSPGDPIYDQLEESAFVVRPLYQLIPLYQEHVIGVDGARWPNPRRRDDLDNRAQLGDVLPIPAGDRGIKGGSR